MRKIYSCGLTSSYQTMDGQIFAFGRNDYFQCAVGQDGDIQIPKPCLFKPNNIQVYQPYMFSTGWFHSAFISSDQKNVYFAGYCSHISISKSYIKVFHNISSLITQLGPTQKFTHVGSGDHVFMVVVDNNHLYSISSTISHVDILKTTGQALKEVRMEKGGVAFCTTSGALYVREYSGNSSSTFVRDHSVLNLNSSSVGVLSFKSENLRQTIIDNTRYPFEYDVYPSFCSHFAYNPQTRTLTATGSNNDRQLGVYGNGSAKDEPVTSINKLLKENPSWKLLILAPGCDFTMIMLGQDWEQTKEVLRFKACLFKQLSDHWERLSDVQFQCRQNF
nr:unnamed protein product [Naegleria fowleri]